MWGTALVGRATTSLLAIGALLSPLLASAGSPPPKAEQADETRDERDDLAAPIVFVLPLDVPADAADSALRTIQAHTRDVGAPFVIERTPSMPTSNRAQIKLAMALAEQHGARGVFWLDLAADDDILLYLHEPQGLDTLMRRLPRSTDSDAATLESLGLVVNSISSALVEGGEIGMTRVAVEPDPEPKPERRPASVEPTVGRPTKPNKPRRGWPLMRLTAAYLGNSFGDELVWQNGLQLALDFRPVRRMVLGASYEVVFPSTVNNDLVSIELRRHPVGIHGGFRGEPANMLALEALGAVTLDILGRESTGLLVTATKASDFLVFSAGVRGRLIFRPVGGLELHIAAGFDVVINNVDYVVQDEIQDERIVILDAHTVRARVGGGMSYAFF